MVGLMRKSTTGHIGQPIISLAKKKILEKKWPGEGA